MSMSDIIIIIIIIIVIIIKYYNNNWNQGNLKVKKSSALFVLFIVVVGLVFPDLN